MLVFRERIDHVTSKIGSLHIAAGGVSSRSSKHWIAVTTPIFSAGPISVSSAPGLSMQNIPMNPRSQYTS